jgi:hypothetical protein
MYIVPERYSVPIPVYAFTALLPIFALPSMKIVPLIVNVRDDASHDS